MNIFPDNSIRVKACLCCGSSNLSLVLNYRRAPLTDNYKRTAKESLKERFFPLAAYLCEQCSHLQLGAHVDPSLSYLDYIYESSVTKGLDNEFKEYAKYLDAKHPSQREKTLLDVGSNDGSFLRCCKSVGFECYGIEPAERLVEFSKQGGLPTACGFFDNEIPQLLKDNSFPSSYDIITFNNVLANMSNPLEALNNAKKLLSNSYSLVCIQTGYHPVQFKKGLFDWVYHEHFSYFTLRSLATLAEKVGLYIVDFSFIDLRGGLMRVLLSAEGHSKSLIYEYFSESDHYIGLSSFVSESCKQLTQKLIMLRDQGYEIYGFGASHSTGILVHNFGIQNLLTSLYDDNARKHGLFMPGTSLEVISPEKLSILSEHKSAIVILAWQYFDSIAARIRSLGYNGKIIKPVLI